MKVATPDKFIASYKKKALALDERIDQKRNPQMAQQNLTARRGRELARMGREADRFEVIQQAYRLLIDMIQRGVEFPDFMGEFLKVSLGREKLGEMILGYRQYKEINEWFMPFLEAAKTPKTEEELKQEKLAQLKTELIGNKIPGFFPTPRPVIELMLQHVVLEPGDLVLGAFGWDG